MNEPWKWQSSFQRREYRHDPIEKPDEGYRLGDTVVGVVAMILLLIFCGSDIVRVVGALFQ